MKLVRSHRRQNCGIYFLPWCLIVGTVIFCRFQGSEASLKDVQTKGAPSLLHSSLSEASSVQRTVEPTPVVPRALKSRVITTSRSRRKDISQRSRRSHHSFPQVVYNSSHPSYNFVSSSYLESGHLLGYNTPQSYDDEGSTFRHRSRNSRPPTSPAPRYRRGPTQPARAWRNYVLEDFLQYIGSGEGSTEEWHHQSRDTAWLELQSSPVRVAPLPTYAYLQSPQFVSFSTSPSRITVVSTVYKTSTEYATTLYSTRTPLVTATVQSATAPSATWQELYTSCSQHVAALESGQKSETLLSPAIATGNRIQYQTETMFLTTTVTSILIETKTVTDPFSDMPTVSSLDFEPTVPIIIAPSPTINHRLPETSTVILLAPSSNEDDVGTTQSSSPSLTPVSAEAFTSSQTVSREESGSSLPTVTPSLFVPSPETFVNSTDILNTVSSTYYISTGRSPVSTESMSTSNASLTEGTSEFTSTTNLYQSTYTEPGINFTTQPTPFVDESSTPSIYDDNVSAISQPPQLDQETVSEILSSTSVTEFFDQETPTEVAIQSGIFYDNTVGPLSTESIRSVYSTDYTTEYLFDRTSTPNLSIYSTTVLPSQTGSAQELNLTSMFDIESLNNESSTVSTLFENASEFSSFPSTTIESDFSTTREDVTIYIEGSGLGATTSLSTISDTSEIIALETEILTREGRFSSTTLSHPSSDSPPPTTTTEMSTVLSSSTASSTFDSTEPSTPSYNTSIELQASPGTLHTTRSSSTSPDFKTASATSTSSTTTPLGSTTKTISAQQTTPTSTIQTTTPILTASKPTNEPTLSLEETTKSTSTTTFNTEEVATIDSATSDEDTTVPATTLLSAQSSTASSPVTSTSSTLAYTMKTEIDDPSPDPEFWVRTIIDGKLRDADIEENKIETGLSEVFRSAFGYGRNEDSELFKNLGEPVTLNIPRSDDPLTENRVRREVFSSGIANPSTLVSTDKNVKNSDSIKKKYRRCVLGNHIPLRAERRLNEPIKLIRRRRQLRKSSLQENDETQPLPPSQESGSIKEVGIAQFDTAFLARNIYSINAKIHNVSHDAETNKTDIIYVVYDGSTPIPADEAVASLRNIINERMSDAIGYKVQLTEEYLRGKEGTSRLTWLESNVWIWYLLAVIVFLLLVFVFLTSTYFLYWKKRSYKASGISEIEERRSTRTFATEADVEASTSGRVSAPTMDAGDVSSTSSSNSSPREDEEEESVLRPQIRKSRQLRDLGDVSGPSGWRGIEPGAAGTHRHLPPPRLPRLAAPMHNLPYADLPPSILRSSQFKHQKDASSEEGTSAQDTDTDDNAFLGRPGSYRRIRKRFHELLADAFNILDGGQKADRVDSLTGRENVAIEHDASAPRGVPSTSGRGSAPPSAPAELGRAAGGGAPWRPPDPYQVPRPRSAADLLQHSRVQPLDQHISPTAAAPVTAWSEAGLGGSRPGSARCITPVNLPTNTSPPSRGPASPPHTTSAGEAALAESLGLKVGDPAVPLIMDIKETLNTLKARGVQPPRRQRYYERPSQEGPQ